MKILVVADHESKKIWDFFEPGMLNKYDIILSCGDLSPDYLQFLSSMSKAEVVYVHGNHDAKYEKNPPLGCISAEDAILNIKGIRILGLGGTMPYKLGPHMYTEKQMKMRVRKLRWKLKRFKGFDILLTHAPAKDINDGPDFPHTGFEAFTELIDKYQPKYFVHGHIHKNYGKQFKRETLRGNTKIINAFETWEIDWDE